MSTVDAAIYVVVDVALQKRLLNGVKGLIQSAYMFTMSGAGVLQSPSCALVACDVKYIMEGQVHQYACFYALIITTTLDHWSNEDSLR